MRKLLLACLLYLINNGIEFQIELRRLRMPLYYFGIKFSDQFGVAGEFIVHRSRYFANASEMPIIILIQLQEENYRQEPSFTVMKPIYRLIYMFAHEKNLLDILTYIQQMNTLILKIAISNIQQIILQIRVIWLSVNNINGMKKKDYDEFIKHCQAVQKLNEDSTLLRVKQSQQLIVVRMLRNSSPELIPTLEQEKELAHDHLESIIDYSQISNDCIAVFTEYSTHTLHDELMARRKSNTKFTLQQLENILVSVVKALHYLQTQSIGHGCISAKDIVVSQTGIVKLIDPSLATSSPLQLMPGYLYSPELLQFNQLQNSQTSSMSSLAAESVDFFKNDIFVVGLLIVQLGLLHCDVSQCVLYDQGCIDYLTLQNYLNEFQCLFDNRTFMNLICGMLFQDPLSRLNAQGVLKFIEDEFESDEDEYFEQNGGLEGSSSSYMTESNNKTVQSFLLSQGPTHSQQPSLRSSRQSLLIQNQQPNRTIKRSTNRNNKTNKTPLIKC